MIARNLLVLDFVEYHEMLQNTALTMYHLGFFHRWGSPYLTKDFFHIMGSKMGDQVLLVVAEEGDELVAGALNIIGGDTLFGRLWGCHPRAYYPSLHFEACYYQVQINYLKVSVSNFLLF